MKYHILLPAATDVGGALDTAQWQAVLRSASALEAYRRYHVREILPWKAAEFLIFSDSFPRSLHFCAGSSAKPGRARNRRPPARPAGCWPSCSRSRSPTS